MITFLKILIKDVLEIVGVCIPPSQRGNKIINRQISPCLPFCFGRVFFFFFFKFFLLLLKLILVLIKFFISDTVLVRAIVRFLL